MKGQKFIIPIISAILGGVVAVAISNYIFKGNAEPIATANEVNKVYLTKTFTGDSNSTDFTVAAERTVDAVVHVKTAYTVNNTYTFGDPFFDFFFGPQQNVKPQPVRARSPGQVRPVLGCIRYTPKALLKSYPHLLFLPPPLLQRWRYPPSPGIQLSHGFCQYIPLCLHLQFEEQCFRTYFPRQTWLHQ